MTGRFDRAFAACPLVAFLSDLAPDEASADGDAPVDAGFTLIEVPLNAPGPDAGIALFARRYDDRVVMGAGIVLSAAEIVQLAEAGGTLVVSPNTDPAVIRATAAAGLVSRTRYCMVSEAFGAGAAALKLFPAEGAAPAFLAAPCAVLSRGLAVGGIVPDGTHAWRAAGADGFGLGGRLLPPGQARRRRGPRRDPVHLRS